MQIDTKSEQQRRSSEPQYWFNKSSDLMAAAGSLHFNILNGSENIAQKLGLPQGFSLSIATWPVYLMLCGLSLELAYKAIIVKNGGTPPSIHYLIDLAKTAGITPNEEHLKILAILQEYIVWVGKYPAPNKKYHESIDKIYNLEKDFLFENIQGFSIPLRTMKDPHPLEWSSFKEIWMSAQNLFYTT